MKFNLKGLNLNMLLLVAILVGVLVVFLRQNNKCMMDDDEYEEDEYEDEYEDGVEGFRRRRRNRQTRIIYKRGIHEDQKKNKIYGKKNFTSVSDARSACDRNPNCIGILEIKTKKWGKYIFKYKLVFMAKKEEKEKEEKEGHQSFYGYHTVVGARINKDPRLSVIKVQDQIVDHPRTKSLSDSIIICNENTNCVGVESILDKSKPFRPIIVKDMRHYKYYRDGCAYWEQSDLPEDASYAMYVKRGKFPDPDPEQGLHHGQPILYTDGNSTCRSRGGLGTTPWFDAGYNADDIYEQRH
jgi:hypothetical protein